jgi:formamidopyrimidine-DNA glycosylase
LSLLSFLELELGNSDFVIELYTHKTGIWKIGPSLEKNITIEFIFDDGHTIYFIDQNKSSTIKFRHCKTYISFLKRNGPDIYTISCKEFERILRMRVNKYRPIGKVLYNKLQINGLGTYRISQMLYAAHVNPNRRTDKLSSNDILIMYDTVINKKFEDADKLPKFMNLGKDLVVFYDPDIQKF